MSSCDCHRLGTCLASSRCIARFPAAPSRWGLTECLKQVQPLPAGSLEFHMLALSHCAPAGLEGCVLGRDVTALSWGCWCTELSGDPQVRFPVSLTQKSRGGRKQLSSLQWNRLETRNWDLAGAVHSPSVCPNLVVQVASGSLSRPHSNSVSTNLRRSTALAPCTM